MALPEFVAPAVAVVGTPALAYVVARCMWLTVRALVVLVVSMIAIKTSDEDRRKACLAVLDKVTRKDDPPWPRRRPVGRGPSSR